MPEKVFTYETEGLSYTVTVRETDSGLTAEITVLEGAMDVNALYFGDGVDDGDDFGLKGSLNMNGEGSTLDGESVDWDGAAVVSKPGLGREGTDKESYISAGSDADTLVVDLEGITLDDLETLGIRATSTTTESGSIKAVSGEEPHDDDDDDDVEPLIDKVLFFANDTVGGVFSAVEGTAGAPITLDADTPPTLENHLAAYESFAAENGWLEPYPLESVSFYDVAEDGQISLIFEITPDEGTTFDSSEQVLAAYDAALGDLSEEQLGQLSVIMVDDGSSDVTPEEAAEFLLSGGTSDTGEEPAPEDDETDVESIEAA